MTTSTLHKESPWGPVQHCDKLADGIYAISTASHGGIWLSEERLQELHDILPVWDYPTFCGSPQWFEEDCDWVVPALAFAADIDHPPQAEAAELQLASMARSMGGKYQRAWEALK